MENHRHQFILSLLAYCTQRELNIERLCASSGIDLKLLTADKTINFTSKQWKDLWLNAAQISKDPLFGLHFGESMQLAALGAVGEIIKTSTTIGEALTLAATLTHLITDLFSMEVIKEAKLFNIIFHTDKNEKQTEFAFKQNIDFFMAFVIHELDGLLLNKVNPQKVSYAHDIVNASEYERVLRYKPTISSSYYLQFDIKYWDETIITGNYALQKALLQYIEELSAPKSNKFETVIYNYLITKSHLGISSIKDVAGNFNLSVRTLQRKLEDEGTNFQHLADQARKQLALKYVKSGEHQVKEISYMLGYNELSAFTRAFKRWTGISPTAY